MIRPPGFRGAAFGGATDGDPRRDASDRTRWSAALGIPTAWAWSRQVHGRDVAWVTAAGDQHDADALVTARRDLPLVVATADCVPVILEAPGAVAVVHMGWRGAAAGVVDAALDEMERRDHPPLRAAIGPAVGPCCYEVGPDVAASFPENTATTRRGTTSVDLPGFLTDVLSGRGLDPWNANACTMCGEGYHSYRRDGTSQRQAAVGWLPTS